MKRIIAIALALGLVLSIAAPAAAIEADFSGYYWARGQSNQYLGMRDTNATSSYMYMKFRLKSVFKISDNISVTTRFDALDNMRWGTDDTNTAASTTYQSSTTATSYTTTTTVKEKSNIDWDEAYATIKTPIGGFQFGRWTGSPWGTWFLDTNSDPGDKIAYILPIANWTFALQYKKMAEADEGTTISDGDKDKYYVTATYKAENWKLGVLGTLYKLGDMPSPGGVKLARDYLVPAMATSGRSMTDPANQAVAIGALATAVTAEIGPSIATLPAATQAALIGAETANRAGTMADSQIELYVFDPYFTGTFGNLGIKAEFVYGWGTFSFDKIDLSAINAAFANYELDDRDIEGMGYYLDLTYDFGNFGINAGYAYASGDADPWDDEEKAVLFLEKNQDFNPLFILFGYDTGGIYDDLGGVGNLVTGQAYELPTYGFKLWYIGADVDATENLNLSLMIGGSTADEVPAGVDDEHGIEYDFKMVWKPMDNLKLTGIIAYLDAGDIFKAGNTVNNFENPTSYFLEAKVSF